MSAPRYLVDTNILLRFLSGEPAAQADRHGAWEFCSRRNSLFRQTPGRRPE